MKKGGGGRIVNSTSSSIKQELDNLILSNTFRKDTEEERFYEIFFQLCRKYSVRWASATPKEKDFIEEVTRVTYERDRAQRLGLPLSEVRPSFVF